MLKQRVNREIRAKVLSKAFDYADSQVYTKDYFLTRHERLLALIKRGAQENIPVNAGAILEHEDAIAYKGYVEEFLAKKQRHAKKTKTQQTVVRKERRARGTYKEILAVLEARAKAQSDDAI